MWERLQNSQFSELNQVELDRLKQVIQYGLDRNMVIILDSHNSLKYYGTMVDIAPNATVPKTEFTRPGPSGEHFFRAIPFRAGSN